MASKDRYVTGQGMFGGPGGTYGKYSVSSNVPSLLSAQFQPMKDIEEQQNRRYKRRYEPGYSGAGYWFWNYPNMVGAIGSGSMLPVQDQGKKETDNSTDGMMANPGSGLGQGGTAASASGAAGGYPA